jgi:hypothetical protein
VSRHGGGHKLLNTWQRFLLFILSRGCLGPCVVELQLVPTFPVCFVVDLEEMLAWREFHFSGLVVSHELNLVQVNDGFPSRDNVEGVHGLLRITALDLKVARETG